MPHPHSHRPGHGPLAAAVQRTTGWATSWPRQRAEAWAVASQQRSRRNAMVAATTLARRRVEAEEAAMFVAERAEDSRTPAAHG